MTWWDLYTAYLAAGATSLVALALLKLLIEAKGR